MPGILARVYVTPKRGILDPQGKAVRQALHALGFGEVGEVKVGKYIEVRLREGTPEAAAARVREMCERLLANAVIEDFRVELAEESL
jgi:phosphoribosylformylglycinamidine synthase